MDAIAEKVAQEFVPLGEIIRLQALAHPETEALVYHQERLDWRAFDQRVERVAAALQREGVRPGETVAIAAGNSAAYAIVFAGVLRAGAAAALLTSSATAPVIAATARDSGAAILFVDRTMAEHLAGEDLAGVKLAPLDSGAFETWMAPAGAEAAPVAITPDMPFNIIYSSGTTGAPKGIVHSHGMRMAHIRRGATLGYDRTSVALLSTPLYSNTTLVGLMPGFACGGKVVVMSKFDTRGFLELAAAERVTHAPLVPVQYQRLLAFPDFDSFDLSAFRMKTSTSAPFPAALKAEVLARWPGKLVEVYGMTEGGGVCMLNAHERPDKLHTVGQPMPGHDIRLIDEDGWEVAPGGVGEIVGASPGMMTGYHNQPEKTRALDWFDDNGKRFIRQGDIGRFDEDGFLVLLDRSKDMIISGGFNIYPSDIEAELLRHPAVAEAAVVGAPSAEWGETPVGFVVLREDTPAESILSAIAPRLGRTQRLSALHVVAELPRSAIGKVLKRELRAQLLAAHVG